MKLNTSIESSETPSISRKGNPLRRIRLEKGLSLKSVADALQVSSPAVIRFETQKGMPNPRRLEQFASVLDTPIMELAGLFLSEN